MFNFVLYIFLSTDILRCACVQQTRQKEIPRTRHDTSCSIVTDCCHSSSIRCIQVLSDAQIFLKYQLYSKELELFAGTQQNKWGKKQKDKLKKFLKVSNRFVTFSFSCFSCTYSSNKRELEEEPKDFRNISSNDSHLYKKSST